MRTRLVKKFRLHTLKGGLIEVDWTHEGLVVRFDGKEQDTSNEAHELSKYYEPDIA